MCLLWKSHLLWINTPFTTSSHCAPLSFRSPISLHSFSPAWKCCCFCVSSSSFASVHSSSFSSFLLPLFFSFASYLPFYLFYFFKSLVLSSYSTVLGDVIFESNLNYYSDNYHKKLLVRVLLWYQKLKVLAFPCPDGMWPTVASLGLHKEQQYPFIFFHLSHSGSQLG